MWLKKGKALIICCRKSLKEGSLGSVWNFLVFCDWDLTYFLSVILGIWLLAISSLYGPWWLLQSSCTYSWWHDKIDKMQDVQLIWILGKYYFLSMSQTAQGILISKVYPLFIWNLNLTRYSVFLFVKSGKLTYSRWKEGIKGEAEGFRVVLPSWVSLFYKLLITLSCKGKWMDTYKKTDVLLVRKKKKLHIGLTTRRFCPQWKCIPVFFQVGIRISQHFKYFLNWEHLSILPSTSPLRSTS